MSISDTYSMKTKIYILFIILFLACLPADAQCAMCRAVIESDESGQTAKGINNGIMYLMVFPYLLVAGVGYAIYRMRKKTKASNE